jgi:predicted ester cyclase
VEDVVAEGDRVVTRFTSSGTQLGEFQGVRATGRRVAISEVAVYRFAGGKIAEQWGFPDVLSLQRQLAEAEVK